MLRAQDKIEVNPTLAAGGRGKPVIFLTKTVDDIPFDLRHSPHIVHEGHIYAFKKKLEERVRWCMEHPERCRDGLRGDGFGDDGDLARMAEHIANYLEANKSGWFASRQSDEISTPLTPTRDHFAS